jgi:hypothetical protein
MFFAAFNLFLIESFSFFNSAKYDFIIIEKKLFPNIPYFVEHFA